MTATAIDMAPTTLGEYRNIARQLVEHLGAVLGAGLDGQLDAMHRLQTCVNVLDDASNDERDLDALYLCVAVRRQAQYLVDAFRGNAFDPQRLIQEGWAFGALVSLAIDYNPDDPANDVDDPS